MTFSQTVAIAAMSTCIFAPSRRPGVAAVAALKVTGDDDALTFTFHSHVPTSADSLRRWVDRLIADDPLLTGYRLGRISRLLQTAGYGCRLSASFNREGRSELVEVVCGRMVPLSVAAGLCDIAAVDEEVLLLLAPISPLVAADLALVNAVASWIIHVRRSVPTRVDADTAAAALAQLAGALGTGAIPLPLAGAIVAGGQ